MDLQWWISGIAIPVVGGLFWLRFHDREDIDRSMRALKHELAKFKLLVATGLRRRAPIAGQIANARKMIEEHEVDALPRHCRSSGSGTGLIFGEGKRKLRPPAGFGETGEEMGHASA